MPKKNTKKHKEQNDNGAGRVHVSTCLACAPRASKRIAARSPPLALVVEPVNAVDGRALVVAAQNEEVFGVFDFVSQEQANGLH